MSGILHLMDYVNSIVLLLAHSSQCRQPIEKIAIGNTQDTSEEVYI